MDEFNFDSDDFSKTEKSSYLNIIVDTTTGEYVEHHISLDQRKRIIELCESIAH
jgi:hypothetical protein